MLRSNKKGFSVIRIYYHRFLLLPLLMISGCIESFDEVTDTRSSSGAIILESPVLKFVDGKPGLGIDGQVYGMIMKLRLQFNRIRLGTKQEDGSYIGYFTYNDKPIMLADLVELEMNGADLNSL